MDGGEEHADWAVAWGEEHAESLAGLGATAVSFVGLGEELQLLHMSEKQEEA